MRIKLAQWASEHGLGSKVWSKATVQIVRLPVGPAQSAFSDYSVTEIIRGSAMHLLVSVPQTHLARM